MWRSPEPVLSCTRNDKFPQKGCSRLRETIIFKPWPARGWPWGSPGARPTVPEAAPCRAQPDMAACRTGAPMHAKRQLSSKPMLSCTRNDHIQILATSWRDPRNRAGASPALTRAGRPKKKASRAGKMLINSARLENGGCGGPRKQCSRTREMTSFLKRYALVFVKR